MVLLIYPDCKQKNYQDTASDISAIQPNVYMAMLHAYLKEQGIEVYMLNSDAGGMSNKEIADLVEEAHFSLIGIVAIGHNLASSTMTMSGVIDLCQKIKERQIKSKVFILGGHPSVLPERTLDETGADYVIVGEGYKEVAELYRKGSNDRIIRTKGLIDVINFPMLDWDYIDPHKYRAHNWHCLNDLDHRSPYGVIWTSLGCPYPCTFCAVNNLFEGKQSYRRRNVENVIKEIDKLVINHGVKNIKIIDDLFVLQRNWLDQFCSLLKDRRYGLNMWCFSRVDTVDEKLLNQLKEVGVNWIAYGFESPNQRQLDLANKKIKAKTYTDVISKTKNAGINIIADVIVGLPEDTVDSINGTYDFCVLHNFEFVNVYPAFAYPGTPFYDYAMKEGLMDENKTWDQYSPYGYECIPLRTRHLTSNQVLMFRDLFFENYHSRPKYLKTIKDKFGIKAKESIEEMVKVQLKRRLYE